MRRFFEVLTILVVGVLVGYFFSRERKKRVPLQINAPSPLPPATVGTPYDADLQVAGGILPYNVTLLVLPAWLTVAANHHIVGTPGAGDVGMVGFVATAMDSAVPPVTVNKGFALTVVAPAPPPPPAPAPAPARTLWWPWPILIVGVAAALLAGVLLLAYLLRPLPAPVGGGIIVPPPPPTAAECPVLNGANPVNVAINTCVYRYVPYATVQVPNGWYADAYVTNQGTRYGLPAGTVVQVTDITLKR